MTATLSAIGPLVLLGALLGFPAAGVAVLIRALPWAPAWKKAKPLSCIACMAGHASWIVYLSVVLLLNAELTGFAGFCLVWMSSTGSAAGLLGLTGAFTPDLFDGEA